MARAGTVRRVNVAVAFDHRGVHLRDKILETLREEGHEIVDLGTDTDVVRIDYPDKAAELGAAIKDGHEVGSRHARGGMARAGLGRGPDRVDPELLPELAPELDVVHDPMIRVNRVRSAT